MLTNWGDLLTNVPSSGGGSTDASDLTTGTLDSARLPTVPYTKGGTGLTALGTASQVLRTNAGATAAEWATITAGLSWTSPTTNALGRYSGGAIVDAAISDDGTNVSITRAPRVTLSGTTYLGLTSAGLAINKGTTAASKMLEVVDSAAAQLRLTHTAGVDFADFTIDGDGNLIISPSGGKIGVGKNANPIGAFSSCLGQGATAVGDYGLAGGINSSAGGYGATALGSTASASANYAVAIGFGATAAIADTAVFGASANPVNTIWAGKGAPNATPTLWSIRGTSGLGTDIAGGDIAVDAGAGTGTGATGIGRLRATAIGSSGTTLQSTWEDRITWNRTGIGFFGTTPAARPAAIADSTDAGSVITQLNLALAALRALGLIAT